jgi:hypothetical protein
MSDICGDCGKHFEIGDWPYPCAGMGHEIGAFWTGDSNIHPSEQVALNVNPRTGAEQVAGRADMPMNPKLAAEGFVRKNLETISQVREFEKRKGFIHERSHYNKNSVQAERDTGSV